jgi:uncharacterized membrane protein YhaH (DUF805 family)
MFVPLGWFTHCLRHYAQFDGRASRPEFWWFYVTLMSMNFALQAGTPYLSWVWSFGILTPHLAVTSRRLHDSGHSLWWAAPFWIGVFSLVSLGLAVRGGATISHKGGLPGLLFLGFLLAWFGFTFRLLYLLCKPSDAGPNHYGATAPAGPN